MMEPLQGDQPGPHECWRELAEHSISHDDLPAPVPVPAVAAA